MEACGSVARAAGGIAADSVVWKQRFWIFFFPTILNFFLKIRKAHLLWDALISVQESKDNVNTP